MSWFPGSQRIGRYLSRFTGIGCVVGLSLWWLYQPELVGHRLSSESLIKSGGLEL